jgi:hypothetical protein
MLKKDYGQYAVDAYLSVIRRFSELDLAIFEDAFAALDKHYSRYLKLYYEDVITKRKQTCKKFLAELQC